MSRGVAEFWINNLILPGLARTTSHEKDTDRSKKWRARDLHRHSKLSARSELGVAQCE